MNEKAGNGRHSGVMMWPGSQFEYGGIKPTHIKNWDQNVPWKERVDIVIFRLLQKIFMHIYDDFYLLGFIMDVR